MGGSQTVLATGDANDGDAEPMPRPDSASASRISPVPEDGPSAANTTIEAHTDSAPNRAVKRSPTRTAT